MIEELSRALVLACQAQGVGRIQAGRAQVLALPRSEVLAVIERVASEVLDLADDWQYLRLVELVAMLGDRDLLARLISIGFASPVAAVRESAQGFSQKIRE